MLEKSQQSELSQEIKERNVMQKFHLRLLMVMITLLLFENKNKPQTRMEINAELNLNALSSREIKEWRSRNFNSAVEIQ